jgi:hypothetical protein
MCDSAGKIRRTLYFLGAVALLGTTITPYLFFWQASGENHEHRSDRLGGRRGEPGPRGPGTPTQTTLPGYCVPDIR